MLTDAQKTVMEHASAAPADAPDFGWFRIADLQVPDADAVIESLLAAEFLWWERGDDWPERKFRITYTGRAALVKARGATVTIQTTDFEGADFREASGYPRYVADRIAEILRERGTTVPVECSGGYPQTKVLGIDDPDLAAEISQLVKVDLWEEFCSEGYKTVV